MKWRIREIEAGVFIVQRKGGLFWADIVFDGNWAGPRAERFGSVAEASAAMDQAIAEYEFRPRTVVETAR